MKKLYTLTAFAAMSATALFAANPGELTAAKAVAVPGGNPVQTVKTVKTVKATKTLAQRALIDAPAANSLAKAPAKAEAADTEWNYLGKAMYADGLLWAAFNYGTEEPYEVDAYQSATDENVYKFENIYPTEYLDEVYYHTDGKTSSCTLTVTENGVLANFDLNLNLNIQQLPDAPTTISQRLYGSFAAGTFSFNDKSFIVLYNGEGYAYNTAFTIALPGAKDYSLEFETLTGICNAENIFDFTILAGSDAAGMKYFIADGIYRGNQNLYNQVAQIGYNINSGSYNINFEEDVTGWYTIFVVTLDEEGQAVRGGVKYFYRQLDFNEDEWVSLGKVSYTDDVVVNNAPTYDVNLYESKANPGTLAADLYANNPYAEQWDNHSHPHYVQFDATDVNNVVCELQPLGVNVGGISDYSLESLEGGKIENGVMTYGSDYLLLVTADMTAYYTNRNGKFALGVPNLLTVTVVVNGTPLEGAYVDFADWRGEGVYTDSEGVAQMPVPVDYTGEFMAYKDGYELATFEVHANGRHLVGAANLEASVASFFAIVHDEEGDPVEGATITFGETEVLTDANGQARINDLNGPDYFGKTVDFTVYKDGYVYYEGKADFTETLDAMNYVTLEAEKATLTVIVNDADGEPLAGAYVTFMDQEATTEANGTAKFTDISAPAVIGKEVDFTAYKDGYVFYEGKADFTEGFEAYAIVTLAAEKATLTVIAHDAEGEPVAGVNVYFMDQEAVTDANGTAKFTDISAPAVIGKEVDFSAYKDGYEYYEGKADFTEGFEAYALVTLTEAQATLSVMVFDANDEFVDGAVVTFLGKEYTAENGKVTVTEIPATEVLGKTVDVAIEAEGSKPWTGTADFTESLEAYVIANLTETVGISAIINDVNAGEAKAYDLNGRRVATPENGQIYIINGLKVRINR